MIRGRDSLQQRITLEPLLLLGPSGLPIRRLDPCLNTWTQVSSASAQSLKKPSIHTCPFFEEALAGVSALTPPLIGHTVKGPDRRFAKSLPLQLFHRRWWRVSVFRERMGCDTQPVSAEGFVEKRACLLGSQLRATRRREDVVCLLLGELHGKSLIVKGVREDARCVALMPACRCRTCLVAASCKGWHAPLLNGPSLLTSACCFWGWRVLRTPTGQ